MTTATAIKRLRAWEAGTDSYARRLVGEMLPKGVDRHPATEVRIVAAKLALMLETRDRTGRERGDPCSPAEAESIVYQLFGPK